MQSHLSLYCIAMTTTDRCVKRKLFTFRQTNCQYSLYKFSITFQNHYRYWFVLLLLLLCIFIATFRFNFVGKYRSIVSRYDRFWLIDVFCQRSVSRQLYIHTHTLTNACMCNYWEYRNTSYKNYKKITITVKCKWHSIPEGSKEVSADK